MIEGSDGVRKVIVLRADSEEITRSEALEKIVGEWTSNGESLSKRENKSGGGTSGKATDGKSF